MNIQLESVSKSFAGVRAMQSVSLDFHPGEIVAVLGANGAGKTTLLRCLAGIVAPDRGRIRFDDTPFTRDQLELRRRFLFIPEYPFLFWDYSAIRNVSIALRLFGRDPHATEERAFALLNLFDLIPLATRPVQELSRGQIYKVGLVVLLAVDPEVWILDEPMASGMDPLGLQAFRKEARDATQRGRTIIYTTQILEIAERFADRIVVLQAGQVRACETLATLQARADSRGSGLERIFQDLRDEVPNP